MIKFIALYAKPANPAAFDQHYTEVHTPLVMKTPGLVRVDVTRITAAPMGGEPAYYQISEMFFESRDAFKIAARSPEWAEAGKDLMSFAGPIVTLLLGETR